MIFAPGDANAIDAVPFGDFCREMSLFLPFCRQTPRYEFDERALRAFMAALFDALEKTPLVLVGQCGRESRFLDPRGLRGNIHDGAFCAGVLRLFNAPLWRYPNWDAATLYLDKKKRSILRKAMKKELVPPAEGLKKTVKIEEVVSFLNTHCKDKPAELEQRKRASDNFIAGRRAFTDGVWRRAFSLSENRRCRGENARTIAKQAGLW